MKLLRFNEGGVPKIGAVKGDGVVRLDSLESGYPTMLSLIAGGQEALDRARDHVSSTAPTLALADLKLLAPIERPGKYLAIGMNFRKHVAEAAKLGVETPKHQFWFNKQTSCLAGPYDRIDPGVTEKLDYEVELVAVIGAYAKNVKAADALKHVFGYTVGNDVSARDWQMHSPTALFLQ